MSRAGTSRATGESIASIQQGAEGVATGVEASLQRAQQVAAGGEASLQRAQRVTAGGEASLQRVKQVAVLTVSTIPAMYYSTDRQNSTMDTQSNQYIEPPVFDLKQRKALKGIDEELKKKDILFLKFLCKDVISQAEIETITRGIHLIEQLQIRRQITQDNVWFLAELLYKVGRADLVKKQLNIDLRRLSSEIQTRGSQLPPFRFV